MDPGACGKRLNSVKSGGGINAESKNQIWT